MRNGICTVVLAFLSIYITSVRPIENIFYTFPSAESVADYVCTGNVWGILNGNESSLLVYTNKGNVINYMISPKTSDGFKIGGRADYSSSTISDSIYTVQLLENKKCTERYILVSGIAYNDNLSIQDSFNSAFHLFTSDKVPNEDLIYTSFSAVALLENPGTTNTDVYSIYVDDTVSLVEIRLNYSNDGNLEHIETIQRKSYPYTPPELFYR